jgi:hypothetical protein
MQMGWSRKRPHIPLQEDNLSPQKFVAAQLKEILDVRRVVLNLADKPLIC